MTTATQTGQQGQEAKQTAPVLDTTITPPLSRREGINRLHEMTGTSKRKLKDAIRLTDSIVQRCRTNGGYGLPTRDELATEAYATFHQLIPHGQTSTPGSPHAIVEDIVLDRSRDEVGIVHDMKPGAERLYCSVQLIVNSV